MLWRRCDRKRKAPRKAKAGKKKCGNRKVEIPQEAFIARGQEWK